jgi:hypothetical protein
MSPRGKKDWIKHAFFGLHYDLHALATDTDLGAELSADHLRHRLELVNPDFVQCDCKGHPGFASYPTKVGYPSPGIVRDALRIHRDVTGDLGIPLLVHYSGLWDGQAMAHHPDWAMVGSDGKPIHPTQEGIYRDTTPFACINSRYDFDLMIPQLIEIIDHYDVDGFWIDGENWATHDCYCPRCCEEFKRRTGINVVPVNQKDPNWSRWRAFHRDLFVEHVRRYTEAVHRRKPDCLVCSNWMYSMRHPGPIEVPVDFLSGDFMSSFGCERAQMEGRYLAGHGVPWNLMAWSFCSPSPEVPAQTKTAVGLCQEAAEVLSCGGGMVIYGQSQRSGWLNDWQHKIFAEVGRFCRERQTFCQHTESVPEAVVLQSDAHVWYHNTEPFCMGDGFYGAEGALHVLMENHYHVDILDETRLLENMSKYSLVVLGEQFPVSEKIPQALEAYARTGGTVLITGSHIAHAHAELAGVKEAGPVNSDPWYISVDNEVAILAGPWQPVQVLDSEIYSLVLKNQQPGKDETLYPAVTIRKVGKGQIVAIHGTIMRTYYLTHQPRLREFIKQLLDYLKVTRRVIISGPPSIEVSLRRKHNTLIVHLVNRATNPTLTPRLHLVEEVPPTGWIDVRVCVEKKPRCVTLEPNNRQVKWSWSDGWLHASIPSVHIHEILIIEE